MNRATIIAILMILSGATASAEEPPANMQQHFRWCATAGTSAKSIARYEQFWRRYLPAEEGGAPDPDGDSGGYGDAPHIMHVRQCAYRLLKLHIEAKNRKRAAYFAQWLEATDPIIGVHASKIPKPSK